MSPSSTQIAQRRDDFPMLKKRVRGHPLVYLDSAATTLKPQRVIDRMVRFYSSDYATVNRSVYHTATEATNAYHMARERIKRWIGAADASEIIFTRGTTSAINNLARSLEESHLECGDEILITEMEHHANLVPWQMLCKRLGTVLKILPIDERGELRLDMLPDLLNRRTKLVALTHISNVLGTINPVAQIVDMAHQCGALVLVDGAQAVAHGAVDVGELGVDFYTFSGHKLYGPTGIGVLYGKRALLDSLPPFEGGGDMVDRVELQSSSYQPPPLKFEAGTPPIAQVLGLAEAIDYIDEVGQEEIADWENNLLKTATEGFMQFSGCRILGEASKKGPILTAIFEGVHALDIATLLDLQGIALRSGNHCAQPLLRHFGQHSALRASFAFYNTLEEVKQLIEAIESILHSLR